MKQYVIDELRASEYEKLKAYLDSRFGEAVLGIHWIPIEADRLEEVQIGHEGCRPFFFAVELQPEKLACELLVRTRQRVRCDCIRYATERQRNWFIGLVDAMFEKLEIKT